MDKALALKIDDLRKRAGRLPRVSLSPLPTPLQECPRLSQALGGKVRIFLKRDDLTATGFGGNKIRKLEFSLGKVKQEGFDVVIHGLAGQSNYCRQTAAACARYGLPCYLVLRRDHKAEDPAQANRLMSYLFGAQVIMVKDGTEQAAVKEELVQKLQKKGRKPYLVGWQDEVFGSVAYSLCMSEILEQLPAAEIERACFCVTGGNGTQGGLVLAKRLFKLPGEVYGFSPSPHVTGKRFEFVANSAQEAAALLGYQETFRPDEILNTGDYSGPEYGAVTDSGLEALKLLGSQEGLVVGPVYTAKGLAGTIDYIRSGKIADGKTVVFIHTGGTAEVFAYNREVAGAVVRDVSLAGL